MLPVLPGTSQTEILLSLWRHWVWADRMRELFDYYIKSDFDKLPNDFLSNSSFWVSSMITTMFLWYGLLYAVCDGIEKGYGTSVNTIAPAFKNIRGRLQKFRNAVFHVQPNFWSPKLMEILSDPEAAHEIRAVHHQVGEWLRKQIEPFDSQTISKNGS